MKENVKVSVIIPIYQVEKYLADCLDSVLSQTLREIEVICVDDGSTDGCADILKDYASRDPRIKVVRQENKGLSEARNRGYEEASGTYIYFLDADDMIVPDALEVLSERADREALELILLRYTWFAEKEISPEVVERYRKNQRPLSSHPGVMRGPQLLEELIDRREYHVQVSLSFVKKSLIDAYKVRFIPDILHEDHSFFYEILMHAKRAGYEERELFQYRLRPGSITQSGFRWKNAEGIYEGLVFQKAAYEAMRETLSEGDRAAGLKGLINRIDVLRRVWMELPEEEKKELPGKTEEEKLFFRLLIDEPAVLKKKRLYERQRVENCIERIKKKDVRITEKNEKIRELKEENRALKEMKRELEKKIRELEKRKESGDGRKAAGAAEAGGRIKASIRAKIKRLLGKEKIQIRKES